MKLWTLALLLACSVFSCSEHKSPKEPFAEYPVSPAPEYANLQQWAAHPALDDFADQTPNPDYQNQQQEAQADVFFIHPTTFASHLAWNANLADNELNATTDSRPIKHQASAFNGSCKVYAPRYRQMTLGGFYTDDRPSEYQALDLAYQDVKAAFEYYLANFNKDRPIVIASHSQGTVHGIRLVKEFFDGTDLQSQLVAAYLVGWPFPADTFANIPVGQSPDEIGCVLGWCTFRENHFPKNFESFYRGSVVTNPVSWKSNDGTETPKSMHKGFLTAGFEKVKPQHLTSETQDGILWISNPLKGVPWKNYHIGDYNLFWEDIRTNVTLRVKTYLQEKELHTNN
ncbi:DUF3089 domain-containing protein [Pontibacter sp. G13]|uniref:DUF3089 domain-containing protein n=1 Tax=Pontibacter sp. G13 TaxID=3074898 RepID=UPI0028898410|nr:DUF3089 domain-containing protein [Pontibacter sp. G13]WNJ16337.1 DUF3089 domain-containing protein [Pontibacter sp. G13]